MAVPPNPETEMTEQEAQNLTFDPQFGVFCAEMVAYDGTNLVRVAVNPDGSLA